MINVFLFPSYGKDIEVKGKVNLNILSDLGLQDIYIILLLAQKLNQMYLENNNRFFAIENIIGFFF